MGGGGGRRGAGDTSRFHFRIPGFKQLCNSSHLGESLISRLAQAMGEIEPELAKGLCTFALLVDTR